MLFALLFSRQFFFSYLFFSSFFGGERRRGRKRAASGREGGGFYLFPISIWVSLRGYPNFFLTKKASVSLQVGAVKCLEQTVPGRPFLNRRGDLPLFFGLRGGFPDFNYTNIGEGKSFADDLNKELGIVSCRVALLLRSTEIKPLF